MPLFNPVLRQYTPPTCTLEIKAQESALSRWVGRPVLKKLRFELHFDDPRQTDDKRITIWGDRTELEALYETVTSYVQGLLEKSPTQLPLSAATAPDGSHPPIPLDEVNQLEAPTSRTFTTTEPLEEPQRGDFIEEGRPHLRPVADPNLQFSTPHLQPRGLVLHDLYLGRLATPESGPVVSLSALQLFDLATALDEYASDVVALPKLSGSPLQRIPLPVWAGTAAAALLAVGLTPALIRLMSPPPKTTTTVAVAPSPEAAPTEAPLTAQVVPADPNAPTPTPSALVSPLPVPTPSGLASPVPNPSGLGSPAPNPSGLGSSLPGSLGTPPTQAFPGQSSSQPPVQFSIPNRSTSPLPRNVPQPSFNPGFPSTSAQLPSQRTQRQSSQPGIGTARRPSASTVPSTSSIPNLSNLPPVVASSGRSRQPSAKQGDTAPVIPEFSPNPALPPMTTAPEAIPDIPTTQAAPNITARRSAPSEVESLKLPGPERQQAPSADNVAKGRLFDTIPQVAEARSYFQQRWKPPTGLTKPLEYSLQIGNDGTIERIIPLTESARNYIDSTGIPLVGERLVSPIEGGRDANIRVVFNADGKVETLLEP